VVSAHRLALDRAPDIGFGRYIISATTPFTRDDLPQLRADAPAVVARRFPHYQQVYADRGWRMFGSIERVYVNERARTDLGWQPRYDFAHALELLAGKHAVRSELAEQVGAKGYHGESTGIYTTR
jgi:nucleoside-diphosphate-sugar epimerase